MSLKQNHFILKAFEFSGVKYYSFLDDLFIAKSFHRNIVRKNVLCDVGLRVFLLTQLLSPLVFLRCSLSGDARLNAQDITRALNNKELDEL